MTAETPIGEAKILSSKTRFVLGGICLLILLLLLAGAISIPFVFDSPSLRYKLGFKKTLLRTGQIFGTVAATLLLLQLVLSARLKLLDRIFALNRLYIFHRVNAVAVGLLALLHPLLVFSTTDLSNIPVELKYWPEAVGGFLLLLLWLVIASGIWRLFLDIHFDRWWLFHRIATFLAAVLMVLHILFACEIFEQGLPRTGLFMISGVYILFLGWVKVKPLLRNKAPFLINSIARAGVDAYAVEFAPPQKTSFRYTPGQFAFITFRSKNLSSEEHPFTISSTPTRPENLLFTIRCSGDWTNQIGRLQPGEKAVLDGPYGQFSHLAAGLHCELVMIAGGIGITPMLSMLRYMADKNDERSITLIWSNRTRKDIVFADEFDELERNLKGLRVLHVFTRESKEAGGGGRLDEDQLDTLLQDCSRQSAVFICGPPVMMAEMRRILPKIGFSHNTIYWEKFGL